MRTVIILTVLMLSGSAQAQNLSLTNDTIRWEIDRFEDTHAHVTDYVGSYLVSYQQDKIEWVQSGGDYKMTFVISSTTGTWDDPEEIGTRQYSITLDGKNGTLEFSRTESGVVLTINVPVNDQNSLPFQLHVTSYSTL